MAINNTDNMAPDALVRMIEDLRRDFNEYKSTPQPIGNGSINYAVTGSTTYGPISIAANTQLVFSVNLLGTGAVTFNGLPAYNIITTMETALTLYVDGTDAAHQWPKGSALSGGQLLFTMSQYYDLLNSGLGDGTGTGNHTIYIPVWNRDTVSHNIMLQTFTLLPRPALKPQ